MSAKTKVSALDHAMQTAHTWINDVAREFDTEDREFAYRVLRAWLHTLRDRLTVEASAHFAAQLPDLIRGIFYAGWNLGCPAFSGLLNLRSLCGELRIQVFGADFAWCPVAECGVNSSLIVEQFDVAGNVLLRFLP